MWVYTNFGHQHYACLVGGACSVLFVIQSFASTHWVTKWEYQILELTLCSRCIKLHVPGVQDETHGMYLFLILLQDEKRNPSLGGGWWQPLLRTDLCRSTENESTRGDLSWQNRSFYRPMMNWLTKVSSAGMLMYTRVLNLAGDVAH